LRDFSYYASVDTGEVFNFRIFEWETTRIEFSEPESYSVESLIHKLSDTFVSTKFQVGFIQSKNKLTLTVRIHQPNISFILSPNLCKLFGIEENYTFRGNKTQMFLPERLLKLEDDEEDNIVPPAKVWNPKNQIFVHTNIIEPQLIGSKSLPVVRIFEASEKSINTLVFFESNPVLYLLPNCEQLSVIHIKVTNEDQISLPDTQTPTTATLHFRRKLI